MQRRCEPLRPTGGRPKADLGASSGELSRHFMFHGDKNKTSSLSYAYMRGSQAEKKRLPSGIPRGS